MICDLGVCLLPVVAQVVNLLTVTKILSATGYVNEKNQKTSASHENIWKLSSRLCAKSVTRALPPEATDGFSTRRDRPRAHGQGVVLGVQGVQPSLFEMDLLGRCKCHRTQTNYCISNYILIMTFFTPDPFSCPCA